jgi:cytochrome P450
MAAFLSEPSRFPPSDLFLASWIPPTCQTDHLLTQKSKHFLEKIMTTECTADTAPGALPLLGHTLSLLRSPLRFLTSLPAWGDLVCVRIGPVEVIVGCTPELTRQVLLNDRVFDKDGSFLDRAREAFGDGLATCPHGEHRRQRRLVQPAFHATRLPGYAQVMTKHITEMTGSWQDGQVLDVLPKMMTLTARTAAQTWPG